MSYQVIARKWRPQAFEEVTGQEHITRTLRNAIEHERLHHAYLFSGARGVGKTTTARLLAKALNCHKSAQPTPTPCSFNDPQACPSCREIAEGRAIDVLEIDAASNTGVDNVREAIIGNIVISAARDRYKVFIVDEVHMLSGAAFNALLKTLEEPPSRVIFIMATTEKHKLPETILSRCQQFEFRTIATAKIAARLRIIAQAEGVRISDEALRDVARAGEGSMRDAQSAFDQVISFATGEEISHETVESALGLASRALLQRTIRAIAEQQPAEILAMVDDLVMRGHDLRNFCRDALGYLRDLLVAKVSDAPELLDATDEERALLVEQAEAFSESDLTRFFHALAETEASLKTAAHPRYQLEIGLVKLIEMRRLAPLAGIIERLTALETALRGGASAPLTGSAPAPPVSTPKPAPRPATPPEKPAPRGFNPPAPPPPTITAPASPPQLRAVPPPVAAPPETPARPPLHLVPTAGPTPATPALAPAVVDAKTLSTGELLERVKEGLEKRFKMILVAQLEASNGICIANNELVIEFPPDKKAMRDSLARIDNARLLREICREQFGVEFAPRVIIKDPANDSPAQAKQEAQHSEKQRIEEIVQGNPAVQQLMSLFGGTVLDIREHEP